MNLHDRERRIREKAYQIWIEEGRPEGRSDAHWDMATELVAIEENQHLTLKPVENHTSVSPSGEPVEPLLAVENAGEFPTLTDQGEEMAYPASPSRQADSKTTVSNQTTVKPKGSTKRARKRAADAS